MSDGRTGFWVRYTDRRPLTGPADARLWFARFDREDPGASFGLNRAVPGEPVLGDDGTVRIGDATLEPGRAAGSLDGAGRTIRWDLTWDGRALREPMLPAALARSGLARSVLDTPAMGARFDGAIEVDGDERRIEAMPGQQGHIVGRGHPQRWAWASCNAFEEEGYAFQAVVGQDRRGPLLTPHLTFCTLRGPEGWVELRGVSPKRRWGLGWWRIRLADRRYRLEAEVDAPRGALLRARYLDPDDSARWCHNTELASSRVRLWERGAGGWREVADLTSEGTTNAEWAGRTPAPGVDRTFAEVA